MVEDKGTIILGGFGHLVWCCGHFSSSASVFTYCLNGFTNSCFRLAVQRMISAKSWKAVKHKLSLAQRWVKKSWEEWGPQISLSWGSSKPQKLEILMLKALFSSLKWGRRIEFKMYHAKPSELRSGSHNHK